MLRAEDEEIIKSVFSSYDKDKKGYLTFKQFYSLLNRLSKHTPILTGVELETARSSFALFNKKEDGKLTFAEFRGWWLKEDKYSYFVGERAKLVHKAYGLYKRYSEGGSVSPSPSSGSITMEKFIAMMTDLGIKCTAYDFDMLDTNSDGVLSFEEFSGWLKWF